MTITRMMLLWCADWPVTAARQARELGRAARVAIIEKGLVLSSSAAAREFGVVTGIRVREAQSRCPDLEVFPSDPALDNRIFEPVIAAVEALMPGVQVVRPGVCAVLAKGPAHYYGGEHPAALAMRGAATELGIPARVGIADGPFTAELAARSSKGIRIVPAGEAAAFLGPLPVAVLEAPQLVELLLKLGVRTLSEFAALPVPSVASRFGPDGVRLHALASGLDSRRVVPRVPPLETDSTIDFEPPLDRADQLAFSCRALADRFIERLLEAGLVCTGVRIETWSDSGERADRSWLHPRVFTGPDIIDRLRWQLEGGGSRPDVPRSAVSRVRIVPESVDPVGNHEEGLWGTGPDERVHHGLSRVQSLLGHDAVLTAGIGGGRMLAERQRFVPWGDRAGVSPAGRAAQRPWPGHLPPPLPTTVFPVPRPVDLVTAGGESVAVDSRGTLSGPPSRFSPTGSAGELAEVRAWAGPWTVDERWWDPAERTAVNRFQVVDVNGTAWLLFRQGERWLAEARYD